MALLKVAVGDIVGVPAMRGETIGFVLMRIIRTKHPVDWSEVFKDFHTNFSMTAEEALACDFSKENMLFGPVYTSLDFNKFFGKTKWPVLAHDTSAETDQADNPEIEFASHDYYSSGIYYKAGKDYFNPPDQRREIEDNTIYSNPQLIQRINLHLSGYLKPGRKWSYIVEREIIRDKALRDSEGKAWPEEDIDNCLWIAEEGAQKFKLTHKKK
jgi:hypothetical protein